MFDLNFISLPFHFSVFALFHSLQMTSLHFPLRSLYSFQITRNNSHRLRCTVDSESLVSHDFCSDMITSRAD